MAPRPAKAHKVFPQIQHIELQWGDLRVDALTSEFAVVGAPWREISVDRAGRRLEDAEFLSALAEFRDGALAIPQCSLVVACCTFALALTGEVVNQSLGVSDVAARKFWFIFDHLAAVLHQPCPRLLDVVHGDFQHRPQRRTGFDK